MDSSWALFHLLLLRTVRAQARAAVMLWKTDQNRAERDALAATAPTDNKTGPWWRDSGLRPLNLGLFFLMFSEFTQGYDASLINNVQQLTRWEDGKRPVIHYFVALGKGG